jgi:phosphoenolpyruvate carboxykinase (ATP)
MPDHCPGVPAELLRPRSTWKNPSEYDARARQLAGLFQAHFKNYAGRVPEAVRQAGPRG